MADVKAKYYLELLTFSLDQQRGDIERITQLQNSYDNKIDPYIWPTQSEIPTAQHFVAVEEALAPALDMLFPETNGIQMIPTEDDVSDDQWRNAEWGLWVMAAYVMRLKEKCIRSLKDCFKCGNGYTIIEPFTITPESSAEIVTSKGSTRIMTSGKPQRSLRARYLSVGKLLPYPEGVDFNGEDATPFSFLIDWYPQWQIEAMYDGKLPGMVDPEALMSSKKQVLENAVNFQTLGVSSMVQFYEIMSGRSQYGQRVKMPDHAPVSVPILRVFEQPGIETWISLKSGDDGDIILRLESEVQQMRVPIIKWSAWPDSDRWFPMSQAEADQKRAFAYDLWLNFMFDMMSMTKNSRLVVNKSALGPGQKRLLPGEDIYIDTGDANSAAAYLQNPKIDPSFMAVGDVLQGVGAKIWGTADFMQKNFTRGGTMAFQDLLNQAQSRQRLAALILETGGLTRSYEHILAYMQTITPDEGFRLRRPAQEIGNDKLGVESRVITQDDLRHGYQIVLDTSVRRMLGGMSDQLRFQMWQALQNNPNVRPEEVNRLFPVDEVLQHRIFRPREELEQNQKDERNLNILQQLGGAQQAAPEVPAIAGAEGGVA